MNDKEIAFVQKKAEWKDTETAKLDPIIQVLDKHVSPIPMLPSYNSLNVVIGFTDENTLLLKSKINLSYKLEPLQIRGDGECVDIQNKLVEVPFVEWNGNWNVIYYKNGQYGITFID
jgi:hypothetical protein